MNRSREDDVLKKLKFQRAKLFRGYVKLLLYKKLIQRRVLESFEKPFFSGYAKLYFNETAFAPFF